MLQRNSTQEQLQAHSEFSDMLVPPTNYKYIDINADKEKIDVQKVPEIMKLDPIHRFPTHILPVQGLGLHYTSIIKNINLENVVELIKLKSSIEGVKWISWQLPLTDAARHFNKSYEAQEFDKLLLVGLYDLPSFDIFSVRRYVDSHMLIPLDAEEVPFSKELSAFLSKKSKKWWGLFVTNQLGTKPKGIFSDLIDIDVYGEKDALQNLTNFQKIFNIETYDVMSRITGLQELFYQLAYYQEYHDIVSSLCKDFNSDVLELNKSFFFSEDKRTSQLCNDLSNFFANKLEHTRKLLSAYDKILSNLWVNYDYRKLNKLMNHLKENAHEISKDLCNMSIKLNYWFNKFPIIGVGGQQSRIDFITSALRVGLEIEVDYKYFNNTQAI